MKVLYVVNNAYTHGNGLALSCRRMVEKLNQRGLEVKLLSSSYGSEEKADFDLPKGKMPIFESLVAKQGYSFAKKDKKIMEEAIEWADIVHLEEPFGLEMKAVKIAKKKHKILTATYHLHPENLFASIHFEKTIINYLTMLFFVKKVYNKCDVIQCPTENALLRLKRWHVKARLELISNGMELREPKIVEAPFKKKDGTYLIVSAGRLSNEKNHITLLKAMKYSKYKDRIQLLIAGRGPIEKKLKKKAFKLYEKGILKNNPIFGFYTYDELQAIYKNTDLYIHCATIEVEGMSCMEAVQVGVVPVISKGKYSATSQFALSDESIYKEKNPKDLAAKIDYWLDNEELRKKEALKYIDLKYKYDINKSVIALEEMYRSLLK